MSSKPRAGINHKEYGVTSEGVNVFFEVALKNVLKIDATKESFTVKMTGGPDGDVGGNELKILFREYGDNAKVVGIADGTGCAEDPAGLEWGELLRLVEHNLPIDHFDPSKLGKDGVVHKVDTEEGVKARNSMHNRVQADAFIPAGGRPNTINKQVSRVISNVAVISIRFLTRCEKTNHICSLHFDNSQCIHRIINNF